MRDISRPIARVDNPLRDILIHPAVRVTNGTIRPNEAPGLGIEVDEEMIRRYPGETGPAYV